MQLRDEGAVFAILRRHQGHGLPAGREDGDALAVPVFDIGAEAARLHRHRPVRQPDRRDIGIGPDAGLAADLPRQPVVRQFELMRRCRSVTPCRRIGRRTRPPPVPLRGPCDQRSGQLRKIPVHGQQRRLARPARFTLQAQHGRDDLFSAPPDPGRRDDFGRAAGARRAHAGRALSASTSAACGVPTRTNSCPRERPSHGG